ncbi:MAG TPA: hypothetical protein VII34_11470 [Pyrinomonadaceae bacterium]
MNNWNEKKARLDAKEAFRAELAKPESQGPDGLRERCIKYPSFARKIFAKLGGFYLVEDRPVGDNTPAIPLDTEFRVFPADRPSRDKMVVLVLNPGGPITTETDIEQIWQCTYFPYEDTLADQSGNQTG